MIHTRSINTAAATELIPYKIPNDSAIFPMITGIMIEPKLAVVKMKLQATEYF